MPPFIPTVLAVLCLAATGLAESWVVQEDPFRLPITVKAGPYRRVDNLVLAPLSGNHLAKMAGTRGHLDVSSLQFFEQREDESVPTPCDYADGILIFRLAGRTEPLANRRYHLYFNLLRRPPAVAARRGAVLPATEPLPGENLVANASFEDPVTNAAGVALTDAEVESRPRVNRVPDPGFEKGLWEIPTNAASLKILLEKGAGREGSMGLLIQAKTNTPGGSHVISSARFPVQPRTSYQWRAWQWCDQPPPTGRVDPLLFFLDADGKPLPNPVGLAFVDKADGQWHQAASLCMAPDAARYGVVQVHVSALSATRCILDDVEVCERLSSPAWYAGYHSYDPGMEIRLIAGDAEDGRRALRLRTSALGARAPATAGSKRFPIKPNTTYAGGCSAKLIEAGASACVSFAAFDKDGKPAMDGWSVFFVGAGRVAGKWEKTHGAGRTKPNAVWGEMGVSVGWGKGEVLFDSVFLREVPTGDPPKLNFGDVEQKRP